VNEDEAAAQAHLQEQTPQRDEGEPGRLGSGEVRVTGVELLDAAGKPGSVLVTGEAATIRVHYAAKVALSEVEFGLAFVHESGITVAGPNSSRLVPTPAVAAGEGHVDFRIPQLLFQPGSYDITTAIVRSGHVYDYLERAVDLKVRGAGTEEAGLVRLPGEWSQPASDDPT
jgi:lipopolysaccharide transport system ATP-binding protein